MKLTAEQCQFISDTFAKLARSGDEEIDVTPYLVATVAGMIASVVKTTPSLLAAVNGAIKHFGMQITFNTEEEAAK